MRRIALVTAFAASLFAAAPGFAFEVQSGGVPLSAEHVALLANRMAGLGGPAQKQGAPAAGRPMPPWMAGREAAAAEPAGGKQAMMGFMLGDRRAEAKPAAGKDLFGSKGFAARR
ncbi:hypothetical protein TSO221_26155 [Azospirillum sp. TSO22-1]|nr:hypothetical protein TSO221_26155 [Azospirillum sp. TSO22-1]